VLASTLFYMGMLGMALGALTLVLSIRCIRLDSRREALVVLVIGIALVTIAVFLPARVETSHSTELAQFIPDYQFNEFHQLEVNASCDRVYDAIKQVTPAEIKFYGLLTGIRRFGKSGRVSILNPTSNEPILNSATKSSFVVLSDNAHEMVLGTILRSPAGFRPRQYSDLGIKGLHLSGFITGAISFTLQPDSADQCRLSTETRVFATDRVSALRFALYWRAIYPGSAIIRIFWLKAIKTRAEQAK